MARRTFFSFDYRHVWKVNQIRSMTNIIGTSAAGFADASIWEEAKTKGAPAIKRMIDAALQNTSVTVVCINHGTAGRTYINYEIDQSLARNNGVVGLHIHHLRDPQGRNSEGVAPRQIAANGFKTYRYTNKEALARHIEEAWRIANQR